MSSKILQIIKKNFKLLLRSKTSALVVLFGPLLIILLVGMAFNNSSNYLINVGVYSDTYDSFTDSFLDKLEAQDYSIKKYITEEECINDIKVGGIHTCLVFPVDFEIREGNLNNINIYIDYSKSNLAWMIKDTLVSGFRERSSELTLDMTMTVIDQLRYVEDTVIAYSTYLDTIDTNQGAIDTFSNEIKKTQEALDLSFDPKTSEVEGVKSASTEIQAKITQIVKDTNASILLAESGIRTAIDDVSDLDVNDSSDLDSIESDLDDVLIDLNTSKIELAAARDISTFTDINNKLNSITSNLNAVSVKLKTAGDSRADVVKKVDSIASVILDTKTHLKRIKSDNADILAAVTGVDVDDASTISAPITTTVKTIVPPKTHLNNSVSALIVVMVMFISILLSATLVVIDKNSRAFFRNFVTPTKSITFVLGTFFSALLIILIQVSIVGGIYFGFFLKEFDFKQGGFAFLILLITTSLFSLLGMFIGYLFNSEETASLASISVGSIFLFISDIILPLESMSEVMQKVVKFNPFLLAQDSLKKVLLFNQNISVAQNELILLGSYSIMLFVIIWMMQAYVKKSFLFKIGKLSKTKKIVKDPMLSKIENMDIKEASVPLALPNGHKVNNLKMLISELSHMHSDDFKAFTNGEHNHIADWIKDSLGEVYLSQRIDGVNNRKMMISRIKEFLK